MSFIEIFKQDNNITNFIYSIFVIFLGLILYIVFSRIFVKKVENGTIKIFAGKKQKTYINMIKSLIKYIFIFLVIIIVLNINGVDVSSMIAGIGVISIILGFAIQDALKDIIKGFDIISDEYYQVGDVIKYEEITGKVLSIGIKTTKIEDVYSKNIISIANRNIEKVEIESHLLNIDIPLSYELHIEEAESVINYIIEQISAIQNVEKAEYKGVNEFDDSSVNYQIKVYCPPILKVQIKKEVLTCILKCLQEKNIEIPYKQIDLHQK